ncbi:hypothetical protein ACJZ2D_008069 [Fusarium nematophilum]
MLRSLAVAALLGVSSVAAVKCLNSKCPEDSPCCSTYGECGVGAFCLGGCDPKMSFSLDSCVPAPVCKDRKMKMNSLDRITDISKYLGDASKSDWVSQGEPRVFEDNILLTMPKDSVGTLLSSTVYMWYGTVKARFKTSRGRGVVTAFILFSDVKDEIDYEFVGVDLETAQTNYYFQGITNYENSENITLSDTFKNYHEYEIRWTPEKIEWYIDGKLGRSKLKKETWNATSQNFEFPQTPSRVQLSLWPGGKETNAKGTQDWAGGVIDWEAPDIQNNGYFFAAFSDVEIDGAPANEHSEDSDSSSDSDSGSGSGSGGSSGGSSGDSSDDGSSDDSSSEEPADTSNCETTSFNQNCGGSSSSSSSSDDSGNGSNAGSRNGASALAIIIAGCALYWL